MMLSNAVDSSSSKSLPRKVTAIGTIGEVNQLFTVYQKNWQCKDCGQENYASRPKCSRCKKRKPVDADSSDSYVVDPALQAVQSGQEIQWQEVVDPASKQIYYYNKSTGVTQWERPAEMGAAPLATGWFGRGQAGSSAALEFEQRNQFYLTRAARKQKDFMDPKKYHVEGANEYNIWYGRYYGDQNDRSDREPATDRCVLQTDAGFTKADGGRKAAAAIADATAAGGDSATVAAAVTAVRRGRRFFCVHFAHGVCAKGADCDFFHRVPLPADDRAIDELVDCFGRSRHSKHRDDMNGTGSFMKPCRTLFVGNLLKNKYSSGAALEAAVWKHFAEWGELESCNVVHRLSIAFPRYRLRTSAEFAKEAMTCQALDQQEVLSIRWAHDDPNPVAKDAIARADKDALVSFLTAQGISVTAAGFEYPANYELPDAKRPRLEDAAAVAAGEQMSAEMEVLLQKQPQLAYPNTNAQYQQQQQQQQSQPQQQLHELADASTAVVAVDEQQRAQQWADYYAQAAKSMGMTPEAYAAYYQQQYYNNTAASAEGQQKLDAAIGAVASTDFSTGNLQDKKNALSRLIDGSYGADDDKVDDAEPQTANNSCSSGAVAVSVTEVNDGNEHDRDEASDEASEEDGDDEDETAASWQRIQDKSTGAFYYFNSRTGESSWTAPSDE